VEAKPAVPKTQGVASQPNRKLFVGGTVSIPSILLLLEPYQRHTFEMNSLLSDLD